MELLEWNGNLNDPFQGIVLVKTLFTAFELRLIYVIDIKVRRRLIFFLDSRSSNCASRAMVAIHTELFTILCLSTIQSESKWLLNLIY